MGKEEAEGKSRPECVNSSNPYHECSEYCLRRIEEAKRRLDDGLPDSWKRPPEERTVHPDCINASNPYHDCSEYCFKRIAHAKLARVTSNPRLPIWRRASSSMGNEEAEGKSRPECINSSNPYHECSDYCRRRIEEAKGHLDDDLPDSWKRTPKERTVHPDCINASNPYHDCSKYCFKRIAHAKLGLRRIPDHQSGGARAPRWGRRRRRGSCGRSALTRRTRTTSAPTTASAGSKRPSGASMTTSPRWKRTPEEHTVHPDCINASNPYHDCSEYCFKRIAHAKFGSEPRGQEPPAGGSGKYDVAPEQADGDGDAARQEDAGADDGYLQMTEKQKKLFELWLKMNEARKVNQQAMVAEKKRMEPRPESRGVSKQKWLEDRKKKIGKLLDSNRLEHVKVLHA